MTIRNEEDIPERMEFGGAAVMAERTGLEGYMVPSNNSSSVVNYSYVTSYADPEQFASAVAPPPPPTPDPTELQRCIICKNKRLFIIIIVVVSLLIVFGLYYLEETAEEE
jgi:hypothetical protein